MAPLQWRQLLGDREAPAAHGAGAADAGPGTAGTSAALLPGRAERSSGAPVVFKVKTSNQGR